MMTQPPHETKPTNEGQKAAKKAVLAGPSLPLDSHPDNVRAYVHRWMKPDDSNGQPPDTNGNGPDTNGQQGPATNEHPLHTNGQQGPDTNEQHPPDTNGQQGNGQQGPDTNADTNEHPPDTNGQQGPETNGHEGPANASSQETSSKLQRLKEEGKLAVEVMARTQAGQVHASMMVMKPNTPFRSMMAAWCHHHQQNEDNVMFEYNGAELHGDETPQHYGWYAGQGKISVNARPSLGAKADSSTADNTGAKADSSTVNTGAKPDSSTPAVNTPPSAMSLEEVTAALGQQINAAMGVDPTDPRAAGWGVVSPFIDQKTSKESDMMSEIWGPPVTPTPQDPPAAAATPQASRQLWLHLKLPCQIWQQQLLHLKLPWQQLHQL